MDALSSLIDLLFYVYIVILLLRLLLQKLGANYFNPITRFIIKMTEPVIKPFRRFIPGFHGYDLAVVVIIIILELISLWLVYGLRLNIFPGVLGSLCLLVGNLGSKIVNIFFFAIIIAAVLSWFQNAKTAMLAEVSGLLAYPIVSPFRQILPTLGGFDFSPLLAIIVLKLIDVFVFYNIIKIGVRFALSA